jgi:PDZ domain-containing protein
VTKQTWTAAVSAVLFVVLAAIVALVPVPFVAWSAGATVDLFAPDGNRPRVEVTGVETFPTRGELRLTTVSVTRADVQLTLPEAVLSYWLGAREVLPRSAVYPAGVSVTEIQAREQQLMDTSQSAAVAAALRAAGQSVLEYPMVVGVSATGPAKDELHQGDFILKVDGEPVSSIADVLAAIAAHEVGEEVVFTVMHDKVEEQRSVTTVAANTRPGDPVVGITLDVGYSYTPRVSFQIDREIGGPSAGLMFALAVYDLVTPGELIAGRSVAGTGTIDGGGGVGRIGGIQEKIAGAERAGATVFLVPAANCSDVAGLTTPIRLLRVDTLAQAVEGLQALRDPARAEGLPGCA